MSIKDEAFTVLPERLETSDYNFSFIAASQSNWAAQLAARNAGQLALQSNSVGAIVTQVNL